MLARHQIYRALLMFPSTKHMLDQLLAQEGLKAMAGPRFWTFLSVSKCCNHFGPRTRHHSVPKFVSEGKVIISASLPRLRVDELTNLMVQFLDIPFDEQ